MRIGAMTHPGVDPLDQIDGIAAEGFDYVDLCVEPPLAEPGRLDARALRDALDRHRLGVVVHTSPYLPLASPHQEMRRAATRWLLTCLDLAAELGSRLVTVHYLGRPPHQPRTRTVAVYAELLETLTATAGSAGLSVAIENSPINRGEVELLRDVLAQVPAARLLLDVGHTHIAASATLAHDFLADPLLSRRLAHVHLSDNDGRRDLHLPLGAPRNGIQWPQVARALRAIGYQEGATLEVFTPDRDYLMLSREKWLAWWEAAG
jgi:sugar phosphate isomerase/epimerase